MKNILIFLVIFSSLLFPKVFSVDMSVLFIILWSFVYLKNLKIDKVILYSILCFVFVICLALLNYLIYQEIFGLLRIVNTSLVFLLTYIFIKENCEGTIPKNITIVFILGMIIVLLEYLNINNSKEIIRDINNIFYTTKDVEYRARGLYPGYASAGLMMGIASIIFFLYGYKNKNNYLFMLSFIALIVTVITSRTGFLIGFLGIVSIIFYLLYIKFSIFYIVKFTAIILLVSLGLSEILSNVIDFDTLEITLKRFLELYNNYQNSGSLSSNSTDELLNSYYLPANMLPFLLGQNLQPWVAGGISSDVGFIQTWHQYGLIGIIAYYFPFFFLIYKKILLVMQTKKIKLLLYSSIIFDILIIISNFKGNYIYAKGVIFITLFLHIVSVNEYKLKRIK